MFCQEILPTIVLDVPKINNVSLVPPIFKTDADTNKVHICSAECHIVYLMQKPWRN